MIEITIRHLGVRVSGDKPKEVIKEAEFFSALPKCCPVSGCGAAVRLTYRRVKSKQEKTFGDEFDYYGMCCEGSPAHESTFGEHKVGGALFYRENQAWTVKTYTAPGDEESAPQLQGRGSPPPQFRQPAPVPAVERAASVGIDPMVCSSCRAVIKPSESESSLRYHKRPLCAGCMAQIAAAGRQPAGTRGGGR